MNALQDFIRSKPMGFLVDTDIPALLNLDRLCPVLVRCGACRFTCGAQYLAHLIAAIELAGDYVRDVSFPVGSFERAVDWKPDPLHGPSYPRTLPPPNHGRTTDERETDPICSVCDEPILKGDKVVQSSPSNVMHAECSKESDPDSLNSGAATAWDESQCGGVYDGLGNVSSDADPGL